MPSAVEIDGREYPINTDFRQCLKVILAFEDDQLTGYEKQMVMLKNLFTEIPEDIKEAAYLANKFLNGGKDEKENQEEMPLRLYSFSKDANFIFSAFKQTHNIDLTTEPLHWWKFLALFMDLGSDTTFCNLINLRKKIKTGIATKEEKMAAQEMGDIFEIPEPDTRSLEEKEKEAEFMAALGIGE